MSTYLDVWTSTLTSSQTKQLQKLLQQLYDERDSRGVSLHQEVQKLIEKIAQNQVPVSERYPAKKDMLADAEMHNANCLSMATDAEALYTELIHLSQLQSAFQQLYDTRIVAELRNLIYHLETTITRQYYLGNHPLGFNKLVHCDVRSTGYTTIAEHQIGSLLYRDYRRGLPLTIAHQAVADAGGFTLPIQTHLSIRPHNIHIDSIQHDGEQFTAETIGCLSNVIDGHRNTFWLMESYCRRPSSTGLTVYLTIDMGSSQKVSYIEIHPVSEYAPSFKTFSLLFPQSGWFDLISIYPQLEFPVSAPVRLHIQPNYIRQCKLALFQNSYRRVAYTPTSQQVEEAYLYSVGLDNVAFGQAKYQTTGIYVSPVLEAQNCGLIGLEATETIPGWYCSIEYYVVKRDLDENDTVLRTRVFPILPLNQRSITHEMLPCTISRGGTTLDTAYIRFPVRTPDTDFQAEVYAENVPLKEEEYRIYDGIDWWEKPQIHLIRAASNLHYSISYIPGHLLTMQPCYLDEQREHWLAGNNAIHCSPTAGGQPIAYSQLWLVALLRGHRRFPYSTPIMHTARLLVADHE